MLLLSLFELGPRRGAELIAAAYDGAHMPKQGFLAAAAALLLALPATAAAADPLPVGEAQGVRVTTTGRGGAVFHFTKRAAGLYRQIAGSRVEVSCTRISRSAKLGISEGDSSGGTDLRAPRRRAPLKSSLVVRDPDYCSVSPSGRQSPLVSVPLTQTGAIALDEREKASTIFSLQLFAGTIADRVTPSAYPTPARFVASRYGRAFRRAGFPIVALAAPTDTPPPRAYGYWSDGRRSAAFVTLSAVGRRLYLQLGPDDEVSTNIIGALFGDS